MYEKLGHQDIIKDDSVQNWLESSNIADSTKRNYMQHIRRFVKYTGVKPDEWRERKYNEDKADKPWNRTEVEKAINKYIAEIHKELSCSTCNTALAILRSFFKSNQVPLNDSVLKPPHEPRSIASITPTPEMVKQLYDVIESTQWKGFFLFLKDSGLRVSDVIELKWKQLKNVGDKFFKVVEYNERGQEVPLKTGKKKVQAFPVIGPETSEILEIHKRNRLLGTRWMYGERKTGIEPIAEKDLPDTYIFGKTENPDEHISVSWVGQKFQRWRKIANIKKRFTAHSLRKFFEQYIRKEIPHPAVVKQLNGHALNDVEWAYLNKQGIHEPELIELYKKSYRYLQIFNPEPNEQIRQQMEAMKELEGQIRELRIENKELKDLLIEKAKSEIKSDSEIPMIEERRRRRAINLKILRILKGKKGDEN